MKNVPLPNSYNAPQIVTKTPPISSGGSNDYYVLPIPHPRRRPEYTAEAEDIIAALNMSHAEGEVFKAVWRKCALRQAGGGKPGDTELRNAEKMVHYSEGVIHKEKHKTNMA